MNPSTIQRLIERQKKLESSFYINRAILNKKIDVAREVYREKVKDQLLARAEIEGFKVGAPVQLIGLDDDESIQTISSLSIWVPGDYTGIGGTLQNKLAIKNKPFVFAKHGPFHTPIEGLTPV